MRPEKNPVRNGIVVLIVIAVALCSCARDYRESAGARKFISQEPDASSVVRAVRNYNSALMLVYHRNDASLIRSFAADRELVKITQFLAELARNNITMSAVLRTITVEHMEKWGPDNFIVDTSESWDYDHRNRETGRQIKKMAGAVHRMRYTMIREQGSWKVFDLFPR
jgi:hypothetical protein